VIPFHRFVAGLCAWLRRPPQDALTLRLDEIRRQDWAHSRESFTLSRCTENNRFLDALQLSFQTIEENNFQRIIVKLILCWSTGRSY
jgi:hypothetical protein